MPARRSSAGAIERDDGAVARALERLADAAREESANIMPATIEAAKAGATTGEWAHTLREVFGDYRAPTGVGAAAAPGDEAELAAIRARVEELAGRIGHRPRILVGKPGLDGHSNGAEQIAVRARDVGMEVIYQGIRLTPEQIVASAVEEDVDVVGLSILSGSHLELIPETVRLLREQGVDAPVVIGGIIPAADADAAPRRGGRPRLHPEGLRRQPDHGRDRRPRRAAQRGRLAGSDLDDRRAGGAGGRGRPAGWQQRRYPQSR